jgi:DNA-binding winged helix-turn-helix (wHTH) protein
MPDGGSIPDKSDFDLGPIRVRPAVRTLETASASVGVEPIVMQLLVTLSRRAGKLVTRQQAFDACWGSAAVGDDSLNRAVAVLRKALRTVAVDGVRIETVSGSGYVLRLTAGGASHEVSPGVDEALLAGFDSWRLGLPEPDHLRLELLARATAEHPDSADAWGMLALLCRQAAEYAAPSDVAAFVGECETAARRALALNDKQGEALVALASVAPLYGRWRAARGALTGILEHIPDHMIALHDLAIVEMATGRVRAAKAIMDGLRARDPLAACLCYKSIYQHWSVNDLVGLDDIGDRAMQLWPNHPAVWMARFWTYAHTARGYAALSMLDDALTKPNLPEPVIRLLRGIVSASLEANDSRKEQAADACRAAAAHGPAQAILALQGLGLLGRVDDLFDVASAYYLRLGSGPVPLRRTSGEASVNDQHRRVTQMLFTPALRLMRADPRFMAMCDRMGLAAYWEAEGLNPDFLEVG